MIFRIPAPPPLQSVGIFHVDACVVAPTYQGCQEMMAVETAHADVSIRVAQTYTGDSGDWIRCVNAWDYELQRRGIHDLH